MNRTAEAMADRMEKGPPPPDGGDPLKPIAPKPPEKNGNVPTQAKLGLVARMAMFPRVLAARSQLFARLYAARKDYDHTFASVLNGWRDTMPTYLKLARANKAGNAYAAEELARHMGAEFADDGRSFVVRNEGLDNLRFSKPGDVIQLSPTETKAFFERRDMFSKAWGDYRTTSARSCRASRTTNGAATCRSCASATTSST